MPTDTGSCWIWGLPDICGECKQALAGGETENLNPARCWPQPAELQPTFDSVLSTWQEPLPTSSPRLTGSPSAVIAIDA
jgi:hypothetical protein